MDLALLALLLAGVRSATPLCLAAMGELVAERSGVLNIGVEGMMLTGALAAFATGLASGSPALACVASALAGCALAALFCGFTVLRGADPIVTGAALNLIALGTTGTAFRLMYPPDVVLADSPAFGELVPGVNVFVLGTLLLVAGVWIFLEHTRPGLSVRAAGERAEAAHAQGIPVAGVRFGCALFGGACAGLAGAALVLWISNTFVEGMTAGRGFISLALVLFGGYRPARVAAGALLFGAASALQFRLQALGLEIPYALLLMTPYLLTLAVLAFFAARGRAPADLGRPFVASR